MKFPEPLDFAATLELLASRQGREVQVIASSNQTGASLTHTLAVLAGALGEVYEMVDSAAAYSVGTGSLHISRGDFLRTQPLPHISETTMRIDFVGFSLQVECTDTPSPSKPR